MKNIRKFENTVGMTSFSGGKKNVFLCEFLTLNLQDFQKDWGKFYLRTFLL